MTAIPLVAVVGNPNAGKSALFNMRTGARQKVGNYPGVTVERKSGRMALADGRPVEEQLTDAGRGWDWLCLTVPPIVYLGFAVQSNLNLGIRHIGLHHQRRQGRRRELHRRVRRHVLPGPHRSPPARGLCTLHLPRD